MGRFVDEVILTMIGLVLFSHSHLAKAFQAAVEMVAGEQEQILVVEVEWTSVPKQLEKALSRAIKKANAGDGVLVMTDLFGGSPANLSLAQLKPGNVEVVSGLNLAMVLKAVYMRRREEVTPLQLARAVVREGRDNIAVASDILSERGDLLVDRVAGGDGCR
jgi:PTS system mannose-specific IIA component